MRKTRSPLLISLVAIGALTACSPGGGGADGGSGPRIELGTGGSRFEALPDRAADGGVPTVPIVAGPQGGYHIWGAVRAWEMGEEVSVKYTVSLVDPATVLSVNEYALSLARSGDAYEWSGIIGLVPDPFEARDREVELKMEVTSAGGDTATDSRRVFATYSP